MRRSLASGMLACDEDLQRRARGAFAIPTQQLTNDQATVLETTISADDEQLMRELAVKQIERRRHFRMRAFVAALTSLVLVVIWAISEYNNAGGWPTDGFSQSSGIPHEWNIWIIYPLLGIGVAVAIDAWNTFRRKPITQGEIRREMDHLSGAIADRVGRSGDSR